MKEITCAFTGPRPQNLPAGCNEQGPSFEKLLAAIEQAIREAIADGYHIFVSGGAMGVDILCAECVRSLKAEHPNIELHFYLPCETQANAWPESWRERYFNLLAVSDHTIYIQHEYDKNCMLRRNRAMVDASSRVIGFHDGNTPGGTAYTLRYAKQSCVQVVRRWPF